VENVEGGKGCGDERRGVGEGETEKVNEKGWNRVKKKKRGAVEMVRWQ
jgi:hypothetical protein